MSLIFFELVEFLFCSNRGVAPSTIPVFFQNQYPLCFSFFFLPTTYIYGVYPTIPPPPPQKKIRPNLPRRVEASVVPG